MSDEGHPPPGNGARTATEAAADAPKPETAGILLPPPVLFLGALGLGLGLDYLVPSDLPFAAPVWTRSAGGAAGIAAGVLLIGWAFWLFRRAGTEVDPYRPTSAIVSSGPYRYSRNPIYVGLVLVYAGLAALFGGPWCWLLLPVAIAVLHFGVIRREEAYLERRFGDDYRAYRGRVRRWL